MQSAARVRALARRLAPRCQFSFIRLRSRLRCAAVPGSLSRMNMVRITRVAWHALTTRVACLTLSADASRQAVRRRLHMRHAFSRSSIDNLSRQPTAFGAASVRADIATYPRLRHPAAAYGRNQYACVRRACCNPQRLTYPHSVKNVFSRASVPIAFYPVAWRSLDVGFTRIIISWQV